VTSPSVGAYEVRLGSWSGGDGYSVIVRIIHANGVVATDATAGAGYLPAVYFRTDAARAHDFAVAVYLIGPTGAGVDYIEIPLTV